MQNKINQNIPDLFNSYCNSCITIGAVTINEREKKITLADDVAAIRGTVDVFRIAKIILYLACSK